MKLASESVEIGGRTLTFEVGRFAEQATSAVLVSYGETAVLTTVVASKPREDLDYFPLSVEYVERLYAGGRIKGSRWVKREGRPTDDAILAGRIIDRSVRPLFPKSYKSEVQVVVTVLSVDGENDPVIMGLVGASAALAISPIPWNGPIGSVRLGFVSAKENEESHFLVNPTESDLTKSDMDLVVSATKKKIHMIESVARQIPEDVMIQALNTSQKEAGAVIEAIEKLTKKVGKTKIEVPESAYNEDLLKLLKKDFAKEIKNLVVTRVAKETQGGETDSIIESVLTKNPESGFDKKQITKALEYLMFQEIRTDIMKHDKRPDGRKLDEIRPLSAEVGVLARTHGSAVFARGQTQALTVVTLGAPSMEQLIESPMGEESKRYIHHYNMPPYSVGETGRVGFSSRREIGHGALAEKALMAVIPGEDVFPYTIRVVSEIMSSNGSTSMASTCGSTLALMDAGVPIVAPVAGISVGLMTDGDDYKLLTDIIGLEDFSGDMDFKVAGTKNGITAIQLDVKVEGLTEKMIEETIKRAYNARLVILEKMLSAIPQSRATVSQYAPKVKMVKIPQEKIGELIGPGGRVIRKIIADTGATVDVNDDGVVTITGVEADSVAKAMEWIEGLTREVMVNEEFTGEVKRILPFGAFVEVLPGKEGMVHVSQMSTEYVSNPEDVVAIGQKVKVRVMEIDDQGRINLSMLFGDDVHKAPPRQDRPHGGGGGGMRERRPYPSRRRFNR